MDPTYSPPNNSARVHAVSAPQSSEGCNNTAPTRVESSSSFLMGEQFASQMIDQESLSSSSDEGVRTNLSRRPPSLPRHDPQQEPQELPTFPPGIGRGAPLQQAAVDAGRPPRAPMAANVVSSANGTAQKSSNRTSDPVKSPKPPAPPPLHDRALSASEVSFLSALTDPLDDDTQRPRRHDRGVSWGMDFVTTTRDTPGIVAQPVLNSSKSTHVPLGLPPRPTEAQRSVSNRLLLDKLAMTDILNPVESEAETAIMMVLEERERASKGETTGASILPNMTDEAVATWQALAHVESLPSGGDTPKSDTIKVAMRATPPATTITGTKTKTMPTSPNHNSQASASSKATQENNKTDFGKANATLGGSKESPVENQKQPQKPGPIQRRSNTTATSGDGSIESTLYSLTNMMRNIYQTEDNRKIAGKDQGQEVVSQDATHVVAPTRVDAPKTQSDTLANHAALIFRGRPNKEEAIPIVTGVTSNIADVKKNDDAIVEEGEHDTDSSKDHDVELGTSNGENGSSRTPKRKQSRGGGIINAAKEDLETIGEFLAEQRSIFFTYMKHILLWLILPATCIAAILFYFLSNPMMKVGYDEDTKSFPSVSWFILFLCVRQVITFSLARLTEVVMIDLVALKTRIMIRLLGPLLTLVIVQSKGWPFTLAWWAVYGLCMLSGGGAFANHWAFYQNLIKLFNDHNPSGNITSNDWNFRVLYAALIIGIIVAIKRFAVGLHLGGRQYATYGSKLATVIQKMIVISQVAGLARQLESERFAEMKVSNVRDSVFNWDFRGFEDVADDDEEDEEIRALAPIADGAKRTEHGRFERAAYSRVFSSSSKFRMAQMLESWEEPQEEKKVGAVSVKGILQFKQTLAFMDLDFPFSKAFGLADSREHCLQSAEEIFRCFVPASFQDPDTLQFEAISSIAENPETCELDEKLLKDLVKIFRPDRDGTLKLIDFVRSIDRVYKDFRLLRASIRNSSHIDQAFEAIINIGFYFIVFCVVLVSWGINPLAMFLSLSSVILAFSFAIGSASAKYFEGIMFILLTNPYDIGDRISINDPNELPADDGVFTWFVEDVSLYYTTVRLGATNEVATIANSSLANSRIVNAARSHRAFVYITLKFGIDVPYTKIQVFKTTVESFVKARPREWLNCSSIRSNRVEADLGFIEYVISLQHRDSWQHIGSILESKAAVMSFCLEVQKQLDMRYVAPPTPVDLTLRNAQIMNALMSKAAESQQLDEPSSPDRSGSQPQRRNRSQSEDLRGIARMFASPTDQ